MFNFIQDENSKILKICTVFSFLDRAHWELSLKKIPEKNVQSAKTYGV